MTILTRPERPTRAVRTPGRTVTMAIDEGKSDASLVVAIGRFDESALKELYDRHGGAVFALARRLLNSRTLAEEVAQEIFLRLWNRPERFDPDRGTLRAFLLADTHGRSIDLLRSEAARRERETKEGRLKPEPAFNLESEVLANVQAETVRNALAELSEGERNAIELAYFGGYTYREVAEQLGEPAGTVKSRIRTGMKRLRGHLAAAGVSPS